MNPQAKDELSDEQQQHARQEMAQKYLSQITEREGWLKDNWWKHADETQRLYKAGDGDNKNIAAPYNILYSNTEVLLPSLYSGQPKPDIRSRFPGLEIKPIPDVVERFCVVGTNASQPGFESFDDSMLDATLSALVPGAGVVRLRHYPEHEFPLCFESVGYKSFIWGRTTKWSKTPWIAFKHDLPKDKLMKQLDVSEDEYSASFTPADPQQDEKSPSTCCVYEFWHKETKEVWFISEEWREKFFKILPDPLGLKGFFPTPGLLSLTKKPGEFGPIPLYTYYKNQAEELNRVTVRLNKVLSAIRVRGVYNGLLGDDLQVLLADGQMENQLVAAKEAGLLAQNGGLEKQIWMLPIDKLIAVATQLYQAREAIKSVIYEITGISDIIRGSSVASETATAQDLKNKWGTVRLRKMQTLVANYARDLFRLLVDAGAQVVPPEVWQKAVQLPIPTAEEQQAARQQLQMLQQQMTMGPQPDPMTGQPSPPPPPPDPKIIAAAQTPNWTEILEKINSDVDRTFSINIQTSSTIDLDTATDKQEVTEFMNALAQLMSGLAPLAQMGPQGMVAARDIVIAVSERFKFGIEIADSLKKLQPSPPQGEDPAQKAEMAKMQMEIKLAEQQHQWTMEEKAQEHQLKMAELKQKQAEMAAKQELASLQGQIAVAKARAQIRIIQAKATMPPAERTSSNANV